MKITKKVLNDLVVSIGNKKLKNEIGIIINDKPINWKEVKGKILVALEHNYDSDTEVFDGIKAASEIIVIIQSLLDKQKREICTEIASYSPISVKHTKELIKNIKSLK